MKKRGSQFENMVEHTNSWYRMQGVARVDKIATPTRLVDGRMFYAKKSTVDYIGFVRGGRAVAFDAKACKQNRFSKRNIKEHQAVYLHDVTTLGGTGFFLVFMEVVDRVFVLPVTSAWVKEIWLNKDVKSMTVDDLLVYGREVESWKKTMPPIDYLQTLHLRGKKNEVT